VQTPPARASRHHLGLRAELLADSLLSYRNLKHAYLWVYRKNIFRHFGIMQQCLLLGKGCASCPRRKLQAPPCASCPKKEASGTTKPGGKFRGNLRRQVQRQVQR
jgi:hypothetical protein